MSLMSLTEKHEEQLTFEQAFSRLEEIVRQLEGGEASLDASLRLFEEGIALTRQCAGYLDKTEARIEQLVRGADGEGQVQPFMADDTGVVS
jgi:exodeoxyribonuclease VII small subunit